MCEWLPRILLLQMPNFLCVVTQSQRWVAKWTSPMIASSEKEDGHRGGTTCTEQKRHIENILTNLMAPM